MGLRVRVRVRVGLRMRVRVRVRVRLRRENAFDVEIGSGWGIHRKIYGINEDRSLHLHGSYHHADHFWFQSWLKSLTRTSQDHRR